MSSWSFGNGAKAMGGNTGGWGEIHNAYQLGGKCEALQSVSYVHLSIPILYSGWTHHVLYQPALGSILP